MANPKITNPFKTKKTIEDMNELSKKLGISSTGDPIKDALGQTELSPEARAKLSEDIKNKNKNNEGKDGKPSSSSSSSSDIKSILAKPELTPEDTKVLLDYIDKNHIDLKAADSELTKDINLDNVKINNAGKVAEKLKEATKGENSTEGEKPITEAKPTEESTKDTTKESTVETPKEPKKETPKNEEKAKRVINGFDSSQFKFEDAANQELYNLALTNGIGAPIKLSTGEMAIPIKGTGRSIVVSDKFAKAFGKVNLKDPKEVSVTLAQMLGGSPVKGHDAYNYFNNKDRAKLSSELDKIYEKIDKSSMSEEDKKTTKELVRSKPDFFKKLLGGGLIGTGVLTGMGLYKDNEDQNTTEAIDDLNNWLDQDNPDNSGGASGGGGSGDYSINLPEFGDPGNTAGTLQEAAAIQPSEEEPEDTIGENQDPESTPYNPTYTPKQEMYNSLASSTAEPREAEPTSTENTVDQLKAADSVSNGGSVNTSTAKPKARAKSSKAAPVNNAPMAGSRPDVSAPGYGAADLSAALGQAAQGAPVDGYDRMFDPSLLEYMRRVSPNVAYGIEQEMRRRGM